MTSKHMKLFLGLFFCFFIHLNAKTQYPNDKEVFFDSLKTFWSDENKTDKAVTWAIEFNNKWPYSFNSKIEKNLVQLLNSNNNTKAESLFLEKLYFKNDSIINAFIVPIYFWNKIITSTNEKEVDEFLNKFTLLLNDSANYLNRTERYGLMIINELESKNYFNKNSVISLLDRIISNLEKYKYIDRTDAPSNSLISWQRYWFRCLYAYTFYQKFLKNPSLEINIQKAAYFSPDFIDKPFESEINTELSFLYNDLQIPNYTTEYFNFLNNNHKSLQALNHITKIALRDPSDENISILKKSFNDNKIDEPFHIYWKKKVDSIMIPFPEIKVSFNKGKTIDFGKTSQKWTYIDVWATWCLPCVKELPEIELFYLKIKNNPNCNLDLYTFSYNSTELEKFIAKKNYTFPVSEIDEDLIKKLGVSAFPTKYLLSPERKYLEIPHGNWQEYIKNYTLTN
ncbi:MAG: TlpA family protein disulfide reductase [Fluviicola sp.]